jgi:DNA repair protein SbcC/Rad50
MKFKKIEISAFRIYDDPRDACFDFTTERGEVANFVALYAPNGFGKTSFYDAVEWAMTKSINRFYIRNKELQRLAHYQAIENELPLIQNSKSERETYVNIVFDDDEKLEVPFKKHGKQKYDLNFDKPTVHNFQRVILSQEWISAFLTESDGETRYKKFMENPELVEVNNYYSNLKHLQNAYDENAENLDRDISMLRIKVSNDGSPNLLTNINSQITALRSSPNLTSLQEITLSTTREQIKELKDFIFGQTIILSREIEDNKKALDDLNFLQTGTEKIINISTYYSLAKEFPVVSSRLEDIRATLSKFEYLEKTENQLSGLTNLLKQDTETRSAINKIFLSFDSYEIIHRDLSDKSARRTQIEGDLSKTSKLLDAQIKVELSLKNQIDSVVKKILSLEESNSKIPNVRQQLEQTALRVKELSDEIDKRKIIFRDLSATTRDRRNSIEELKKNLDAIRNNIFTGKLSRIEDISELNDLRQLQLGVQNQSAIRDAARAKVSEQRQFNDAIAEFIQIGLNFVNEGKLDTCPLCEHTYTSHGYLAEKISKNTSLNNILQDLIQQENSATNKLLLLEEELLEKRRLLEKSLTGEISLFEEEVRRQSGDLELLNRKLTELQNDLRSHTSLQFEIQVDFKGLSIDDFVKSISDRLATETENRKRLDPEYTQAVSERERLQAIVQSAKQEMSRLTEEAALLSRDSNYSFVLRWFEINRQAAPDREALKSEIAQLDKRIAELRKEIETLATNIRSIRPELISFDKIDLKSQQQELEGRVRELQNSSNYFVQFVKKIIAVDARTLTEEKLSELIRDHETARKLQIDNRKTLLDQLLILTGLCENIFEFLQSEKLKLELQAKEIEYQFLLNTVKPRIENEIQKTKHFLLSKIKEFFYIDLINDIYKKIDPHPDFREVRFNADFDCETPRLDIFVINNQDAEVIIPNLYFSTAQINILSLAIFLASALNSSEYNCIFVDDPIQSLDSINMLSTIDLIRSIVVNGERQIILSTHDKNFYDVLQKKIPSNFFRSKFIELESFGKVKCKS